MKGDNQQSSRRGITVSARPGHVYELIRTKNEEQIKLEDTDLTENLDVIVEFKAEPLFLSQKKDHPGLSKTAYSPQVSSFRNDILKLYGSFRRSFGVISQAPEIKDEFYRVFNGVSIRLPRAIINSLHSLPYVKKVHIDKEVKAFLNESVPLIKADSLWQQYSTRGDSIVIGILDSGIDYLHPALGGGFGKGFKVIGGYDCYYGDNDPMDDYGHGTHVAGIAAADGLMKGVAPKAFLMAIKVLGRNGSGLESTILKGLERAVDPNGDGNSNDMVDIINMSFGASGYPEDAMSTAVNNTAKLGIVCCAAAGNYGLFNSIGSPGTAELAITAGATDKADALALFSSKGPDRTGSAIKPDLAAPGVNITSVKKGDGFVQASGTSMASPHVAGASALLKKLHPGWQPADIKSALMTTANDIGEEVMAQGAGRIDVLEAAKVTTLFNPCHLSFGLDDIKRKTWIKYDSVIVRNESPFRQDYRVSFSGLRAGISISASPSEFSLNAGEQAAVVFQLTADNSILPKPEAGSFSFSGNVFFKSTNGPLHLPWAFEKASRVVLNFEVQNTRFILSDEKNYYKSEDAVWKGASAELLIPPGKYDLLALYSGESDTLRIITKENLMLQGSDTLSLEPKDALYKIEFSVKDKSGKIFEGENSTWICQVIFPDSSAVKDLFTYTTNKKILKCSQMSGRFKINTGGVIASKDNRVCVADFNLEGVSGSEKMTNDYSNMIEEDISLQIPLSIRSPEVFFIGGVKVMNNIPVSFGGSYLRRYVPEGMKWNGKILLPKPTGRHRSFEPAAAVSIQDSKVSGIKYGVDMPPFTVYNDSVGLFTEQMPSRDKFLTKSGGTISFKNWLLYLSGYHSNNYGSESSIAVYPYLYGQMDEFYFSQTREIFYKIFDGDKLLRQDTLRNFSPVQAERKKYRSEFSNIRYYIEGFEAAAVMNCRYDLSHWDPNPPVITSLQIRNSAGVPESRLGKGEKAKILFSACDMLYRSDFSTSRGHVLDDSTAVFIKEHSSERWQKLRVLKISEDTQIGCYYSADISPFTDRDSSALDVKIILYDASFNSTEYILKPAIALGKFRGTTGVQEDKKESIIPREYALSNNYPNPFNPSTTIDYSLPGESALKVEIFDITGQKVATLFEGTKKAGSYKLQWNAGSLPSGIYFCRFRAAGQRHFVKTLKLVLIR